MNHYIQIQINEERGARRFLSVTIAEETIMAKVTKVVRKLIKALNYDKHIQLFT